ncbi:hypothetical protein [Paenibacillus hexagrammi]|uniref:Lipoprotein n=1 Tax=Paenibacillus hexagrammi TaxID=2908839 RepID=A0ABY3SGI3_9BACL|nr:hypothetical protein [Paenibacillus sp. YPD9-1]UJF32957.1 hypothetical protein L0M14_25825 [Paenibacillus sp. YPD9-1]
MFKTLLIWLFILIFTAGCTGSEHSPEKLRDLYPGNLMQVDEIHITIGATGEKKMYRDPKQIQEWLKSVQDIEFTRSPDQSKKDGFLYAVTLLEGNTAKMSFTTNSVGDTYYVTDAKLVDAIKEIVDKGVSIPAP